MILPVANGLRTDHPVPGLPFINDERLPLDNPDAIERTGRNQGEGLWGRTDSLRDGGWVAFTTEPKNRTFAWAVHFHPEYGRTVLLVHDRDWSDLHYHWMYGSSGFLYRHGGYWWDGSAWHRPGQVLDRAFEHYDPRPVRDAITITAADLLAQPATPASAKVTKIADFTASETPLPNWRDHLALWAGHRHLVPDALPPDRCVVDLRAPELEPNRLVDRAGLARIADIALNDLPDPKHGRRDLPPPQAHTADGPRWSEPVARDWAERRRSTEGPAALLAATTTFGSSQPRGLVTDHNLLTKIIKDSLEDEDTKSSKRRFAKTDEKRSQETAATLAWWPAVALTEGPGNLFSALRTTLIEAVVGGLADDVERARKWNKKEPSLGDIRTDVVKLLDWYIQRNPGATAGLFGEILLIARTRLDLAPEHVGRLLRRSFHLDSELDGKTIDTLLDMTLPPSAKHRDDR
ncbi:hypothetical protein AMK16_33125 [Streptomyces sp. CB00455]|nr:hypothetical protein AMK16_33125 [Streptomyces sp. CB00455]